MYVITVHSGATMGEIFWPQLAFLVPDKATAESISERLQKELEKDDPDVSVAYTPITEKKTDYGSMLDACVAHFDR